MPFCLLRLSRNPAPAFDLTGRPVDQNRKGVRIVNGKKQLKK